MTVTEKISTQLERTRVQILLLALLCGIIYGQVLGFDYVFDDIYQFEMQSDLRSGSLTWHMLSKNVIVAVSYFRPLVLLTWFAEFHWFGLRPSVSHGINALIFFCNILLVRSVALAVLKKINFPGKLSMRAWLAAVIYAVHPALVESVAWVSGRFDILCTLFMLLAIRFFLAEGKPRIQFIGALICSLLAMASKELGVVLIGTLFCVAMAVRPSNEAASRGRLWHDAAAVLAHYRWGFYGVTFSLLIYFVIRAFSVDSVYSSSITPQYLYYSFITRQLPLEAMRIYTGLTILPSVTGISFFRNHADHSAWTLASSLGTLLMIAAVIWMAAKGRRWSWLTLAGFTGLVLVIHIIPINLFDNIVQERFLAMPLAFFAMAAVSVKWSNIFKMKQFGVQKKNGSFILGAIFTSWLFVCALTTLSALPTWKNNLLWWGINYNLASDNERTRSSYTIALFKAGQYEKIIDMFDPEVKHGKEIKLVEFFYYARSLQAKDDPQGDVFLEQLIQKLDHAQIPPAIDPATNLKESLFSQQIGSMYSNYSMTKFKSGHIETSLYYANIGIKYFPESFRFKPALIIMMNHYVSGDFDAGWSAVKAYAMVSDVDNFVPMIKQLTTDYCDGLINDKSIGANANKAACDRLRKSNFFRVRNFLGPIP